MLKDLVVSDDAKEDISQILSYTYVEYGEAQEIKYRKVLTEALERIQTFPSIGHTRRDLPEKYRAALAGQHVVIYRDEPHAVIVYRILHGRMDFTKQF